MKTMWEDWRCLYIYLYMQGIFFGHAPRHVGSSLTKLREGRDQPIPSAVEAHT